MLWRLVVDIFESSVGGEYPVVQHAFYGKTKSEALGYYQAHLKTDTFLAGCVQRNRWEQVRCTTESRWERA